MRGKALSETKRGDDVYILINNQDRKIIVQRRTLNYAEGKAFKNVDKSYCNVYGDISLVFSEYYSIFDLIENNSCSVGKLRVLFTTFYQKKRIPNTAEYGFDSTFNLVIPYWPNLYPTYHVPTKIKEINRIPKFIEDEDDIELWVENFSQKFKKDKNTELIDINEIPLIIEEDVDEAIRRRVYKVI